MLVKIMETSEMIWIVLTIAVIQSVSAVNSTTECASPENITYLDTKVDMMNASLQIILQDTSIQMDVKYASILSSVCDDQTVKQVVLSIENQVASCPALVQASKVVLLELGPLSFLDLLKDFQSVDHFCECKPLLLQVLAIEMAKSDILYSDPGAYYPEVINLTWVCMMTSPPSPINFTSVALLVRDHKQQCPAVFQYSTINILGMEGFILNYCEDFSPENFTCALNYTHDQDFNTCLELVDQNVTTPADDKPRVTDVYDCRRADCVKERMAGCTGKGMDAYMWSVNFRQPEAQYQLINCEDINGVPSGPYLNWFLLTAITALLRL